MTSTTFNGVRRSGDKFEARIKDGKSRRTIGRFDTAEEAFAAYLAAKEMAQHNLIKWSTIALTKERLHEVVSYDPSSGDFTRLARSGVKGGETGGNSHPNGYRYIRIDGRRYMAHRVAWMYMTGAFPLEDIDHIDGNRSNNIFSNLRQATRAENTQNRPMRSNSISGLRGVFWHKPSAKFSARIVVDGVKHYLGYFTDPIAAHQAYLDAKTKLHHFQPVPRDL